MTRTRQYRDVIFGDIVYLMEIIGYNQVFVWNNTFDGGNDVELSVGDRVDIRKSEKITRLIKASNVNFYEILRNKLGGN